MDFTDIEVEAKDFCRFHEQTGCQCDPPVTDKGMLMYRLRQKIDLNNQLNSNWSNVEEKAERQMETNALQLRLDKLRNS